MTRTELTINSNSQKLFWSLWINLRFKHWCIFVSYYLSFLYQIVPMRNESLLLAGTGEKLNWLVWARVPVRIDKDRLPPVEPSRAHVHQLPLIETSSFVAISMYPSMCMLLLIRTQKLMFSFFILETRYLVMGNC